MSAPAIPVAGRPRFAAQMVAVWRWHHMARGEELSVVVRPGEWPDGEPLEVKGVPVVEDDKIGGANAVLVLGRVGSHWRAAYQIAAQMWVDAAITTQDLAIATVFMEFDGSLDMTVWLHPDPETGEVPMWTHKGRAPRAGSDEGGSR